MMICDADFDELFPATRPRQDPEGTHPPAVPRRVGAGTPAMQERIAGISGPGQRTRSAGSTDTRLRRARQGT